MWQVVPVPNHACVANISWQVHHIKQHNAADRCATLFKPMWDSYAEAACAAVAPNQLPPYLCTHMVPQLKPLRCWRSVSRWASFSYVLTINAMVFFGPRFIEHLEKLRQCCCSGDDAEKQQETQVSDEATSSTVRLDMVEMASPASHTTVDFAEDNDGGLLANSEI